MDERKQESGMDKLFRAFALIAIVLFVGVAAAYFLRFAPGSSGFSRDPADWAEFGEYIGGTLGGAFGFLAFIGVLITVYQQRLQLDAMREDSMATHRPEISILSFEPSHEGIEEEKIAAQVMYVNKGRSAAKNVRIQAKITNRQFPLQTGIALSGPGAIDLAHPDLASGIKSYFLIASQIPANSATVQQVRESRGQDTPRIVCIGCISYFDGMNGRRETGFCRVFNAANERWELSGNTEYEYSY
jgi:hypothetical protein